MTPGARIAAAIEVLADMEDGLAAEQALTRWARRSRFAGSKDRAAVRDHVFDVLRCRNSAAYMGQAETPRALMIGVLRVQGTNPENLFDGVGHAPVPLSDEERQAPEPAENPSVVWNLSDWLMAQFKESLGTGAADTAIALQSRAPITLRVNLQRTTRDDAQKLLAAEGVTTVVNPLSASALTVTEGERRIRNASVYKDGLVEFQDAASQAVVDLLPSGGTVLDYCAGGGGKSLALAMDPNRKVAAHDINQARLTDLTPRATRAGADIAVIDTDALTEAAPFDTVLCDAPCSGSGAWRRAAEAKWTLTPERLDELTALQDEILDQAAQLVGPQGLLAYATCSVLKVENEERVDAFLRRNPDWETVMTRRFDVDRWGDGFFTAHLRRI